MQTLVNLGTSDGFLKENYSPDDERQRPDALKFREKLDELRAGKKEISPDALQRIMEESMRESPVGSIQADSGASPSSK